MITALTGDKIQNVQQELSQLENRLTCTHTVGVWQPSRYSLFVWQTEQAIESLRKIISEFPDDEINPEERIIIKRANVLLERYLNIWEIDFA